MQVISKQKIYGLILAAPLFVAGCGEETEIRLYEPHVYKGKWDQHETDPKTQSETLRQRFRFGQTDR